MSGGTCARCRLPAPAPHATEAACIAALGAALEAVVRDLEAVKLDVADRQARDERARELHAEAEADLARGG